MKNFRKLWSKKLKDDFGSICHVTCWEHLKSNHYVFNHQYSKDRDFYQYWSDEVFGGTANLKFWINEFTKHPITLGK